MEMAQNIPTSCWRCVHVRLCKWPRLSGLFLYPPPKFPEGEKKTSLCDHSVQSSSQQHRNSEKTLMPDCHDDKGGVTSRVRAGDEEIYIPVLRGRTRIKPYFIT